MTPNCPDPYVPLTAANVRTLLARIDKSQRWIAETIGISERRLRYLVAGSREVDGKSVDVLMTYPEQFALECLAIAAETMQNLRPRS